MHFNKNLRGINEADDLYTNIIYQNNQQVLSTASQPLYTSNENISLLIEEPLYLTTNGSLSINLVTSSNTEIYQEPLTQESGVVSLSFNNNFTIQNTELSLQTPVEPLSLNTSGSLSIDLNTISNISVTTVNLNFNNLEGPLVFNTSNNLSLNFDPNSFEINEEGQLELQPNNFVEGINSINTYTADKYISDFGITLSDLAELVGVTETLLGNLVLVDLSVNSLHFNQTGHELNLVLPAVNSVVFVDDTLTGSTYLTGMSQFQADFGTASVTVENLYNTLFHSSESTLSSAYINSCTSENLYSLSLYGVENTFENTYIGACTVEALDCLEGTITNLDVITSTVAEMYLLSCTAENINTISLEGIETTLNNLHCLTSTFESLYSLLSTSVELYSDLMTAGSVWLVDPVPVEGNQAASKQYVDDAVEVIEGELDEVNEKITSNTTNITTNTSDIAELQSSLTTVQGDVATLNTDIAGINTSITTLDASVSTNTADITTINTTLTGIQADVTGLDASVTTIEGEIVTIEGEITVVETETATNSVAIAGLYAILGIKDLLSAIFGSGGTALNFDESLGLFNNISSSTTSPVNTDVTYTSINISVGTISNLDSNSINSSSITSGSLNSSNSTINNLESSSITSGSLNSSTGTINNLESSSITSGSLNSSTGTINNLDSTSINTSSLNSSTGTITNLESSSITSGSLTSTNSTITNLDSSSITSSSLNSSTGTINNLDSTSINTSSLTSSNGTITNLDSSTITSGSLTSTNSTITNLYNTSSTVSNLIASNSTITNLHSSSSTSNNLVVDYGTVSNLNSTAGSFFSLSGSLCTLTQVSSNYNTTSNLVCSNSTVSNLVCSDSSISSLYLGDLNVSSSSTAQYPVLSTFYAPSSTGTFQSPRINLGYNSSNSINMCYTYYGNGSSSNILSFGHTNVSDNQLVLTRSGYVGINNSSPGQMLTIGSGTNTSGGSTAASIKLQQADSNPPDRSTAGIYHRANVGLGVYSTKDMSFECNGSSTPNMYINNSGNVGIGTTSPGYILDVNGMLHSNQLLVGNSTGTSGGSTAGTVKLQGSDDNPPDRSTAGIYFKNDVGLALYSVYKMSFEIYGSTTSSMFIDFSGNVGIGNTAPAYALDVTGSINASSSIYIPASSKLYLSGTDTNHYLYSSGSGGNNTYFGEYYGNFNFVDTSSSSTIFNITNNSITSTVPYISPVFKSVNSEASGSIATFNNNSGSVRLSIIDENSNGNPAGIYGPTGYGLGLYTDSAIRFITNYSSPSSYTNAMMITQAGKVGINTTSPGYTLDVTGTMNCSGALTAGSISTAGTITASNIISPSNIIQISSQGINETTPYTINLNPSLVKQNIVITGTMNGYGTGCTVQLYSGVSGSYSLVATEYLAPTSYAYLTQISVNMIFYYVEAGGTFIETRMLNSTSSTPTPVYNGYWFSPNDFAYIVINNLIHMNYIITN